MKKNIPSGLVLWFVLFTVAQLQAREVVPPEQAQDIWLAPPASLGQDISAADRQRLRDILLNSFKGHTKRTVLSGMPDLLNRVGAEPRPVKTWAAAARYMEQADALFINFKFVEAAETFTDAQYSGWFHLARARCAHDVNPRLLA